MINKIPDGQKCQAFFPFMIFPSKTSEMPINASKANTSCLAPAYIYLEGTRGKRFLCDFHYFHEKKITIERTPELWDGISQILIDNTELIKETFAKPDGNQQIGNNVKCLCGANAYVKVSYKENNFFPNRGLKHSYIFMCNFHYRKIYYRYVTHGLKLEDFADIRDERHRMPISISQEAEELPVD